MRVFQKSVDLWGVWSEIASGATLIEARALVAHIRAAGGMAVLYEDTPAKPMEAQLEAANLVEVRTEMRQKARREIVGGGSAAAPAMLRRRKAPINFSR